MRSTSFILIAACGLAFGCSSISRKPDPAWLNDFDRANAVVISKEGHPSVTISDRETLQRLREIYTNSSCKPYIGTLPADIGHRTIAIAYQGNVLRSFTTSLGMFWEDGSYDEMRTTELDALDSQWVETLFERIPSSQESAEESLLNGSKPMLYPKQRQQPK
ncbi:MAG: hypothetical protein JNL58_17535 [Planctomyces sp.]|nr:hypothetical protein [Planctomyces sp.]